MFPSDNNGVLIQLNAIPDTGQLTAGGSLIFGIGTQSNNGLGTATVLTLSSDKGNFSTQFNGQSHNNAGFIDSGSNGFFFLDSSTVGMPACPQSIGFYCPASTTAFAATNVGVNGSSKIVNFNIGNADVLFQNGSALNDVGGPNAGLFDFGLPFFFGRSIYTAIEGQSTPAGAGPYFAY